jgi:polyisoprenoid-binding protein YceI
MTLVNPGLAHFAIDARASLFTVQAFAAGMVAVVAHSPKFAIRDITGETEFVPETLEKASLHLKISVGSLEIMDEVSAADRREIERVMFDEVLEKNRYPWIEYTSSRVSASKMGENMFRVTMNGDLTLHGVTRGMTLESQVVPGEDTLRAQGSFTLMQTDYRLKIASIAGGTLKLKDELKCSYFILGRRQEKELGN